MAVITEAVRRYIRRCDGLGWVCTVSQKGMPNVSPRYVLEIGEDYLVWGNSFTNKTYYNMLHNPTVSIGFADYVGKTGYELKGTVEMVDSGPLYDRACREVARLGFPLAKQVTIFRVREVREL